MSYASIFPNVHVLFFFNNSNHITAESIRTPHAITCISPLNKPPTVSKSSVWFKAF